jgi:ribonuclease J
MLYKHALLARDLGIAAENIFVMENGQVLEIGRRRGRINGKVTAGRILIDGFGIGDVGNAVLKERKMLSEGGIVVVNIIYSKKSGKIVYGPEIFSKGFIFERDSEHIIEETRKKIASICVKNTANGKIEWNAVRTQLRNNLSYFINDNIGRRPIVLPLINEV